ncbi:MAG: hypothetical protein H0U75_13595 [Legionella sp.]|nr:hypothetical protein [Legionella sp.]
MKVQSKLLYPSLFLNLQGKKSTKEFVNMAGYHLRDLRKELNAIKEKLLLKSKSQSPILTDEFETDKQSLSWFSIFSWTQSSKIATTPPVEHPNFNTEAEKALLKDIECIQEQILSVLCELGALEGGRKHSLKREVNELLRIIKETEIFEVNNESCISFSSCLHPLIEFVKTVIQYFKGKSKSLDQTPQEVNEIGQVDSNFESNLEAILARYLIVDFPPTVS